MADLFDRSLKVLIRQVPPAFFRLLGVEVDPATVNLTDVTVNLPEHRADGVFLIGAEDDPERSGLHVEFQMQPDFRVLRTWFLKNAALTAQFDMDVLLVALYLTRRDRATFSDAYNAALGKLENRFQFSTIHLWEHAERIRSGELAELAPLLVLCEEEPTEQTLQEERALILGLDAPAEVRADLLAVATMVGTRYFAREVLAAIFRGEMEMIKEGSLFDEWLDDALKEGLERGLQQGLQQGKEQGLQQGLQQGEAHGARQLLMRLLQERFGELPATATTRVERMEPSECETLAMRLLGGASLADLGLAEPANEDAAPES